MNFLSFIERMQEILKQKMQTNRDEFKISKPNLCEDLGNSKNFHREHNRQMQVPPKKQSSSTQHASIAATYESGQTYGCDSSGGDSSYSDGGSCGGGGGGE